MAGISALGALCDSSRRCAAGLTKTEGTVDTLLSLVLKVASMDASNAAAVGQSVLAIDALIRLVRFEQNDKAMQVLLLVAAASDTLLRRLVATRDLNTTLMLLSANSPRVQASACVALDQLLREHPELAANVDVFARLDLLVSLLQVRALVLFYYVKTLIPQ